MQLCMNSIQDWVSKNCFKFSTSKMVCIHFHQQYSFSPRPVWRKKKEKMPVKVVNEAKFFGLIFDTKLTFKNHVHLRMLFQEVSLEKTFNFLKEINIFNKV